MPMPTSLCIYFRWPLGRWGVGVGVGGMAGGGGKFVQSRYRGGGGLVRENFCPGNFSAGKIPPQSLKVMGKIAPHFSMVKGKAYGRLSLLRRTPLEEKV